MILSLIGMSNSGKTYWAKKLESVGFRRFSCDDYIEENLVDELKKLGFCGIRDVSQWLGQPYDRQYSRNSNIYLKYEIESLQKFLQFIKVNSSNENIVIDTTGSVIYTGDKILTELRRYTQIIYLDTPKAMREEMYQLYLKNPKPVIWGSAYKKLNGESDLDALKRCYPHFLDYRMERYRAIVHITIDYFLLRKSEFTAADFLKLINPGK